MVHVASGVSNPLRYGHLVELVQSWFTEHPIYDATASPSWCPTGRSPGVDVSNASWRAPTSRSGSPRRLLGSLPVRGERADLAARVEERRALAERALGYVQLYGAYTETEALFRVDRLLELWDRLSPEDRELFCFDPGVIDWDRYVHEIHLPSVVEHARVRTTSYAPDDGRAARPCVAGDPLA